MATTGTDRPMEDSRILNESAVGEQLDIRLRWRIAQALQSSLDLNTILEVFFAELVQVVSCDGMDYQHEVLDINIATGRQSLHACSYRLITQQDCLGTIRFTRSRRFAERELATMESLLSVLVFPVRNALRYHDAVTAALVDPLTGAGNRVALDNTLGREIELAKRYDQAMAVAMLDLDHFKRINDCCGHARGDEVLCALVNQVRQDIRGSDTIFRYGGEEFVVLLTNTTVDTAVHIGERLRAGVFKLDLQHAGKPLTITISLGIAMLQPTDTIAGLLDRADQAMYCAKAAGRNRLQLAGHGTARSHSHPYRERA